MINRKKVLNLASNTQSLLCLLLQISNCYKGQQPTKKWPKEYEHNLQKKKYKSLLKI